MMFYALLRRFCGDRSGAVLPFIVVLIPALLLVGGAATDISQLNAQRRYTQSQADLAAQSAARHLPDPVAVRAAVRRVVAANPRFGDLTLADSDIRLGSYSPEGGFVPVADQYSPAGVTAVEVDVPSPFDPILLGPVLSDDAILVRRKAVAAQSSGIALFMLRNRLAGLDLQHSGLSGLLTPLGLGVTANVLSYEGLLNTRLRVSDLLGLVTAGLAAETLTFDDVLRLPIAVPELLGGLVRLGALPPQVIPEAYPSLNTITFQDIMMMSPALARLRAGDILPDLSISALDFLGVLAQLQARPEERLGVGVGLDVNELLPGIAAVNRLVDVSATVGLIRPPVWVLARMDDTPPQVARVSQTGAEISASTLSLLDLTVTTGASNAEARLKSLNCAASRPSDVAAVFDVTTSPVTLDLRLSLLRLADDLSERDMAPLPLSGSTRSVPITYSQIGTAVKVSSPLSLSGLTAGLKDVLGRVRTDVTDRQKKCSGVLGALLCPVTLLASGITAALTTLLGDVLTTVNNLLIQPLLLDNLVAQLQAFLGLTIAEAEIVLAGTACSGGLVQ